MWGDNRAEGGAGREKIHLRQNKGDSLVNTPQGSGRQDSQGETVHKEAVGGGCFSRGKMKTYGTLRDFPLWNLCLVLSSQLVT